MTEAFSTSFHRSLARDDHSRPIERALLRLSEAIASKQRSYEYPLEFARTPQDPAILSESHEIAERLWTSHLHTVLLIGIGGSNLGAKAVSEALAYTYLFGDSKRHAQLLCLDTCEPRLIERTLEWIEQNIHLPEEIAIIVATKSGTTAETLINADSVLAKLLARDMTYTNRVVVISDPEAPTRNYAQSQGFLFAPIPPPIGGRYSVFTPMGLIPLQLLGVDIKELRVGASQMFSRIVSGKDPSAVRLAREIASMRKSGISVMDLFFFDPALESLGKWARQLIAESLGKEHDRDGRTLRSGVTPTVSVGSVDLHSMAQLVFGGPKDKWTMLVSVRESGVSTLPANGFVSLAGLDGRTPTEVHRAILSGVRAAYAKNSLPLLEVELPRVSPYVLGAWMAWMMAAVYIASEILNVNAFDQPAVEDYKQATRMYLAHQH
jgi:glucose-6-phosphate isomerase